MLNFFMRKQLLITLCLVVSMAMLAVPAKRGVSRKATLDDGSSVTLVLCGDEFGHWWESADGRRFSLHENGTTTCLSEKELARMTSRASLRQEKTTSRRIAKMTDAHKNNYIGSKKGLVILVEFPDLRFEISPVNEKMSMMFNEAGYHENNHIGSVHDYFLDQSYGLFDLSFDVVGPIEVSNDYAYYGKNNRYGDDMLPATMVAEACAIIDGDVNFADYDWDGDGTVDQVFVIYAGYGENAGAPSNTLWPHEWTLSEASEYGDGDGVVELDGVIIDTYAISCELAGKSETVMNGIGTACHEFSHCLGFPDFYNTQSYSVLGTEDWDLLSTGSYNGPDNNGEIPAGYTAYERWFAGWLTPIELTLGMNVEAMLPLNEEPEAYIVYNDGNHNEYYLLENRRSDRWFSYWGNVMANKDGLLITHVDYSEKLWADNTVNTLSSHQRMYVISANNASRNAANKEYGKQLYPYEAKDSLTNTSLPMAKVFNKNTDGSMLMNKPIRNITRNDDRTISFICGDIPEDPNGNDNSEESGINEVPVIGSNKHKVFTITGQAVDYMPEMKHRGIYILNGRKEIK